MNLLCLVGLHRWRYVFRKTYLDAYSGPLISGDPNRRCCTRCGKFKPNTFEDTLLGFIMGLAAVSVLFLAGVVWLFIGSGIFGG